MEYTLNIDRAYELVHLRTGIPGNVLWGQVIERLASAGMLLDSEECGHTIAQLAEQYGMDLQVLCAWVLNENADNLPDLLGNITVMARDMDNPCPDCGCSLVVDNQECDGFAWEDLECSNHSCSYKTTTEPDWDCLSGGKDY